MLGRPGATPAYVTVWAVTYSSLYQIDHLQNWPQKNSKSATPWKPASTNFWTLLPPSASIRNVRRLREAKGLSPGALAADAGIFQELISPIENGAATPELDTLGKIAVALGVHPGELLRE